MKAFCLHWDAGTYNPSSYSKSRYHSLTGYNPETKEAFLVEGDQPPEANKTTKGKLPSNYVRHCGGHNSDTIGHAICSMGGNDVREHPLNTGSYPPVKAQWDHAVRECVDYCEIYGIPVVREAIFLHAEVRELFNVGKYKWDVTVCQGVFDGQVSPKEAGDRFRADVQAEMKKRAVAKATFEKNKAEQENAGKPEPKGFMAAIQAAIEAFFSKLK